MFWLCWVFAAAGLYSSCGERGLLSSCAAWASHGRARAQELCCAGLVVPWHVGSSQIRD